MWSFNVTCLKWGLAEKKNTEQSKTRGHDRRAHGWKDYSYVSNIQIFTEVWIQLRNDRHMQEQYSAQNGGLSFSQSENTER